MFVQSQYFYAPDNVRIIWEFKKIIKYTLIFMLMIVETVTVVTYATCTFNMTIVNVQSTAYVKKKKLKTI